jgi:hypothetical protein
MRRFKSMLQAQRFVRVHPAVAMPLLIGLARACAPQILDPGAADPAVGPPPGRGVTAPDRRWVDCITNIAGARVGVIE